MTKKSFFRRQRDAAKVANASFTTTQQAAQRNFDKMIKKRDFSKVNVQASRVWDDLLAAYEGTRSQLDDVRMAIGQISTNPETLRYIEDPKEFKKLLESLAVDMGRVEQQLQETYAKHKDRSGGPSSTDDMDAVEDHFKGLELFMEYQTINERLNVVILQNTLGEINQAVALAESKMMGIMAKAMQEDPDGMKLALAPLEEEARLNEERAEAKKQEAAAAEQAEIDKTEANLKSNQPATEEAQ